MRTILITLPEFFDGESTIVNQMFDAGLEILHLRKPKAGIVEIENFVLQIKEEFRDRVVLHSHFSLVGKCGLRGAHMGVYRPLGIEGFKGQKSFSCHSFEEVVRYKEECDYVFLSPIFNSISKEGYDASFTSQQLDEANKTGIIDSKVIALGGVCLDNINKVREWGFGGYALLGDVWQNANPVERLKQYLQLF